MADWRIIAQVACAMGYAHAFTYADAAEVFEEIRRFHNPKTGYDLRGASHDALRKTPIQWPCAPGGPDRNPIRYLTGFPTATGKAQFHPRPHMPPAEMPDVDYPLILNTGRLQHQWHTMTKTGKVPTLTKLNPGPFIEIHPEDAQALGIAEGDRVEVRSRRGRAILPAVVTTRVAPGGTFAPMHWNDVFGDDLAINALTSDAVDPISLQPEFKVCAVALTRLSGPIHPAEEAPAMTPQPASSHPADALAAFLRLPAAPPVLSPSEQHYMTGFTAGLRLQGVQGIPILPDNAPFAPDQRHLVNGLLAGMFARAAPLLPGPLGPGNPDPLGLANRAGRGGRRPRRRATDRAIHRRPPARHGRHHAQGSGHRLPRPAAGQYLWRRRSARQWRGFLGCAQRRHRPRLDHLAFSVLAFGDSSYDQFCGFGRKLDARMEALGAKRLTPRHDCEPDGDETGWLGAVIPALSAPTGAGRP
jgi:sulfite reductase (NADPH) flavoprotein alpha-component